METLAWASADVADSTRQTKKTAMRAIRNTPRSREYCPALSRKAQYSDRDCAFQIEDCAAGDCHPVAPHHAGQRAAAARQLPICCSGMRTGITRLPRPPAHTMIRE